MKEIEIYIKGAYIPREEKMRVNILIKKGEKETNKILEIAGKGSTIEAEYLGLIKCIKTLKKKLDKENLTFLKIFTINEVIVKQIAGEYRAVRPKLLFLLSQFLKESKGIDYQIKWLPKSEMGSIMKTSVQGYSDKEFEGLLDKIDLEEEDIWI